LLSHICTMS